MIKRLLFILCALPAASTAAAQGVWQADRGDGTYRNPVLYADYSDPDVIRTGDDYWMTASSFACVPGLQILHSTDLVNWQIVGAALPRLNDPAFDRPSHGNGVWAPAIRFHDGWYHIYWGDPDRGIYMIRTQDPRGAWSDPVLVKAARGMIDPCPLWDDDGRAYLVHGWAGSRAGFKSVLSVSEMTVDGTRLVGGEVLIFDGHDAHPTVEGPKFYKRGGWYYVFAPAGGVKPGWQLVLRSRTPFGPYECRKVLHQGDTATPGPHQGGWVEDTAGGSWFLHFVDEYAYGRVVHLQPMTWTDDGWCLIGEDRNGDGIGEPVERWTKPVSRVASEVRTPAESDEFDGRALGLQWQWAANPQPGWYFCDPSHSRLRLMCVLQAGPENGKGSTQTVGRKAGPDAARGSVAAPCAPGGRYSAGPDAAQHGLRAAVPDSGTEQTQPDMRSVGQDNSRAVVPDAAQDEGRPMWRNLWDTPNLLLQKIPAPACTFTAKVRFRGAYEGDRAGLAVMGVDYALLAAELRDGSLRLVQAVCIGADKGAAERIAASVPLADGDLWLRCRIEKRTAEDGTPRMVCRFAFSTDGNRFTPFGDAFTARAGRWIGAKAGLFATAERKKNDGGWLDADYFRVSE